MALQERIRSAELEFRNNIGVGLLIVNLQGQVYTVRELQGSPNTERAPGQIAVSTEKGKIGENFRSNLLGALGEFCSDKDIPYLKGHLLMVGSPRVIPVNLNGKQLACSLVTLVCDVDAQPIPAHREEVSPHGWMKADEIVRVSNLRPLSRQILNRVLRGELIQEGLRGYRDGASKIPILAGFGTFSSFEEFVRRRNLLPDRYANGNHAKEMIKVS